MATAKVILFKHNTSKNGEHPIYLRITKDRKTRYLKTGATSLPEHWDEETNYVSRKHPTYFEVSLLIDKKRTEANKILLGLELEDKDVSVEEIAGKLTKKAATKTTVLKYFDQVIARLEKQDRIGYANIFKSTKNSLSTFRKEKDFRFSDVNYSFLSSYEQSFLDRGVKLNSIFVFMRTFKTLLNYAKNDELVTADYDPFKDFPFTKYRGIKTKKRAIGKEDIKRMVDLDLEQDSRLFHARNYFMFSFYNRGINFVDMAHLKWANVKKGRLNYQRAKTKEEFTIGMLEPAKAIIDYYKENYNSSPSDYIFPILDHKFKTAKSIDNRIDRMLKIVNKDLKEIGEMAEIDEKLTTYVARHSYATIMKRSGVSTSVISEALGHDSEKTTRVYLDSFESSVLDEASKAIL